MTSTYFHAESTARKWGGKPEDYIEIHNWFDETKSTFCDFRHRAMRHHAEGIFWCEEKFGPVIINSDGKAVPTRYIGEQHVMEDCAGTIPSIQDWLTRITPERWMNHATTVKSFNEINPEYLKKGD